MERNLMVAGFGGQGVMTLGKFLADATCNSTDKNVTFLSVELQVASARNLPSVMTPCPPKPATIRFRSIFTPPPCSYPE